MRSDIVSVLPVPAPAVTITSDAGGRVHDAVLREVDRARVVRRLDCPLRLVREVRGPGTVHDPGRAADASGTTAHSRSRLSLKA